MRRNSRGSGGGLDSQRELTYWYNLAQKTIIAHQHPVTGLIPAQPGSDTWVRDCTYAIHSIWALSLAFQKIIVLGYHSTVFHELKHRTIKGMRGLLVCMMNQNDKVSKFIETQSHLHCLHAKYDTSTGKVIVGDDEWGHLQLDATSLFLLTLAQITSSGYVIIQSLSEVDFIQSLVHYIHFAYRTPDFGVFERGDKNNRGIRELSSCSVGLAKSALVAIRGLNLFGAQGGLRSVIKVPPDMSRQCNRVLEAILPRGSISKEFDSSILTVLSYPAFAVEKDELIKHCKELLDCNLKGRYGYKRFLMDGYKTSLEDKARLHYNPGELRNFEGIECEWPLYSIYMWLDALFSKNYATATNLKTAIDDIAVHDSEGLPLIPEYYYVSGEKVDLEKSEKGSQNRLCGGKIPFIWAQSLYIVGGLLENDLISCGDIDPLNRRLSMIKKPSPVVQIVLFSEDEVAQNFATRQSLPCLPLKNNVIKVITPPVVTNIWETLGLKLSSTLKSYAHHRVSTLRTSIIYHSATEHFISVPEYAYQHVFYDKNDDEIFIQKTIARIAHLSNQWLFSGRPTLVMLLSSQNTDCLSFVRFLETLKSGSFLGVQVKLCSAEFALSTAFKQMLPTVPELIETSKHLYSVTNETPYAVSITNVIFSTNEEQSDIVERIDSASTLLSKWEVLKDHVELSEHLSQSLIPSIEAIYNSGCNEKNWYIARHCAALLHKVQHSICDDVTHILVNQKQISFGEGDNEETVTQPPTPSEFFEYIVKHSKKNYILFVLYQEILNYLSQMIQKNLALFKGILRVRLNLLISLVAKEISNDHDNLEALCEMSPITLYRIIYNLFRGITSHSNNDSNKSDEEESPWERRRCIDGSLNRLPENFHHNLYTLLNKSLGIDLEGNVLPSFPLINEMTAGEPQFAITVENWFDKIKYPQLRQLYVEVIMIFASIHKLSVPSVVKLQDLLISAHNLFLKDIEDGDRGELLGGICREFYMTPPTGRYGTLGYMSLAVTSIDT